MLEMAQEEIATSAMGSALVVCILVFGVVGLFTFALTVHFVRGRLSQELPQIEPETFPDEVSVGREVAVVPHHADDIISAEDIALTTAPGTTSSISPTSSPLREILARGVFNLLDSRGTGFLSCGEMQLFAEFMGFRGTDAQWAEEWAEMCSYLACDRWLVWTSTASPAW